MLATTESRRTQTQAEDEIARRAHTDPSSVSPRDARTISKRFFDQLGKLDEGTHDYRYVRGCLIEINLSLVQYAASRFRHRGPQEMEDIIQVGTIGLIKAIDRFELTREVEFISFAVPYITGEIKRFFRDTSWAVHVPRRLQEARLELAKATEELSTRLGRSPSTAELAELMQLEPCEVVQAQVASNGYASFSLDGTFTGGSDDSEPALADFVGFEDQSFDLIVNFRSLAPLIAGLDERDRRIIHLRFVEERTQSEIGAVLHCSQMHVSRLITRVIAELRAGLMSNS
ncbi:RNA polymerase sigma factor [Streptomyces longisporoflavus]|uniref:SigB/SigF/SigG family RNA polymerase sigma factor n=1 Tax=Streptomyces longisporoflavus TaxID=28044 RepID=UPI00167D7697|nr:SigB/SigF/SigG family RNA polymerase sigma factor [Streptomyces longisporoflavus]GGV63662.1 RNA polymerase sigma factor [Streptomyces longisporoflavus]